MNEILRINIPEEVSNNVQRLHYELLGYINLLKSVISPGEYSYSMEVCECLMKDYQRKNMEYMLTLDEIKEAYLPHEYRKPIYYMTILFNEYALSVTATTEARSPCSKRNGV